jgi:hypothetical protein
MQEEILKIGQFYEHLRKPLKPGLYVADLRLTSDIQQIYVQTCRQNPSYLPSVFVRDNPHVNKKEWSWLDPTNQQINFDADSDDSEKLIFYRQLFQATSELFQRYKRSIDEQLEYCICNDFLLEYGQVSIILVGFYWIEFN